jgi:hypothetical protein
MTNHRSFTDLSDHELLAAVHRLAGDERRATAHLIASLAEFDARRLYLGEGCSSLFTYCTQVLHFSEHAAYGRIEAARAARRFPLILDRLVGGEITLTAIGLLARHLTSENHRELLDSARYRSKREVGMGSRQRAVRLHRATRPVHRTWPSRISPRCHMPRAVRLLRTISSSGVARTISMKPTGTSLGGRNRRFANAPSHYRGSRLGPDRVETAAVAADH